MKKVIFFVVLVVFFQGLAISQESACSNYVDSLVQCLNELAADTSSVFPDPLLSLYDKEIAAKTLFVLSEGVLSRTEATCESLEKPYNKFLKFIKKHPDGTSPYAELAARLAMIDIIGNQADLIIIRRGLRELREFPAEGKVPIYIELLDNNLEMIVITQLEVGWMVFHMIGYN